MFARCYQLLFASSALLLSSGCAMCCGLYDNDYLATSELLERTNPSSGRVGSVFSDPNAGMSGQELMYSEGIEIAPETLPDSKENSANPQPTPAAPQPAPATGPPARELIQRPVPTPAKPVSVKEDTQSRRTSPQPRLHVDAPRRLATTPTAPLPTGRRFERQSIRQVTARQ
ncbi:MAG: hypothetical protein JNL67_08550 [Planctomycetaceae bacterium]|nr:hypothetical protein [Planctomycetaceae bacterium]